MDNNNIVGEMLEKGQSVATNQFKKAAVAVQQQVASQNGAIAPDSSRQTSSTDVSQSPLGPGVEQNQSTQNPQASQVATIPLQQVAGSQQNTPAVDSQIAITRERLKQEMHKTTYFDPTFNRPKPQDEPVAEKLEREKQEDLWEKQQEEAKMPEPIAVSRAKRSTEMNRGASG